MDSAGRLCEASGVRPPAHSAEALPWLSRSSVGASACYLFLMLLFAFAHRRASYHLRLPVIT